MRLLREQHGDALKRYAHIKRGRGSGSRTCGRICPGTARACSRERDHRGPHVAHGSLGAILAVWDAGDQVAPRGKDLVPPEPAARRRGLTKRPVGLPSARSGGGVELLRRYAVAAISSWQEIAFFALFVVFVKLAIDVLLTLR